MEKIECMGCRTSFHEGEKHKLENLTTEYKNFQLPLKDEKCKRALLKAIVSFLNTRGGTIYIGVEDSQCAVQGQLLQRKEQDDFKLYLKTLLEKIHPRVDLKSRQEVVVQFVPVLNRHDFEGKYVAKIIVQQGNPSHIYSFCERVKLEAPNGKVDQFQIFYAYERHNMGGSTELKGLKLLEEVHNRAKAPGKIVNIFHQGCNPQPPHLDVELRKFFFTNTTKEHMQILEDAFEAYFEDAGIEFNTDFVKEEGTIVLTIQEEGEFKTVQTFIVGNIEYLNRQVFKGQDVYFEIKGEKGHYFHIHNNPKVKTKEKKREERAQREGQQGRPQREPRQEKQQIKQKEVPLKEEKQKQNLDLNNQSKQFKKQEKIEQKPKEIQKIPQISPSKVSTKKFCFTLTHIDPRRVNQLQSFLMKSIFSNLQKQLVKYVNTVEVVLSSQEDYHKYAKALYQRAIDLEVFGFKNEIRMGRNTGCLRVCNYDKGKRQQMKAEIESLMSDQLQEVEFVKDQQKGNYSCLCRMRDRSSACQWLDRLLQNRSLAKFGNSQGDKKNKRVYKLKIYLDLDHVFQ